MDDLISRQELLKRTIYNPLHVLYISSQDVLDCPSAQQWIPCTERLPSMGKRVIVSAVHHKTENVVIDILRYHGKKYGWEFKDICTPVAWMPLPEIYKGEEK